MNCSKIETLLDGYHDGDLDETRRAAVAAHLASCPACRQSRDELCALARAVRTLPRGLAPARDLLPGIRRATVARRGRIVFWAGLAATLFVVSTVVWLVLGPLATRDGEQAKLVERGAVPDLAEGWSAARVNQLEFDSAGLEYEQASARLLQLLDERGDSLSPETRELVTDNLRIIDRAIDEVRGALESAPDDPANGHVLNSLRRQKLEFLWRLSRLSS